MDAERAGSGETYSSVLREVGTSVKGFVQSEADLLKTELRESSSRVASHSVQAAVFGALLGISVLPFLAFLVIGLGVILGGIYWLSALIISALCAGIGGVMTFRAYEKMKEVDLTLPKTRENLERGKEVVVDKVHDIQEAAKRRTG